MIIKLNVGYSIWSRVAYFKRFQQRNVQVQRAWMAIHLLKIRWKGWEKVIWVNLDHKVSLHFKMMFEERFLHLISRFLLFCHLSDHTIWFDKQRCVFLFECELQNSSHLCKTFYTHVWKLLNGNQATQSVPCF